MMNIHKLITDEVPFVEAVRRFRKLYLELAIEYYGSQSAAARAIKFHRNNFRRELNPAVREREKVGAMR